MAMLDGLYSNDVLALAADIPHVRPLADAQGRARKVSMVCGSEVEIAVNLDDAGAIAQLGVDVKACALGQASASIFARNAVGATHEDVVVARDALEAMLKDAGAPPSGRFSDLAVLAGVRDYPPRHASTMLAFRAAALAIEAALSTPAPIRNS